MAQENKQRYQGEDNLNAPRLVGEILHENFENSNEPLYAAYRKYKKDVANSVLFQNFFPNTELGMDIKLLTRKPGRLPIGEPRAGYLTRDSDTHMTFIEGDVSAPKVRKKRNPKPYDGELLTYTQREDGTYRSNFKDFVIEPSLSMKELRKLANRIKNEMVNGYPGLIEKEDGDN